MLSREESKVLSFYSCNLTTLDSKTEVSPFWGLINAPPHSPFSLELFKVLGKFVRLHTPWPMLAPAGPVFPRLTFLGASQWFDCAKHTLMKHVLWAVHSATERTDEGRALILKPCLCETWENQKCQEMVSVQRQMSAGDSYTLTWKHPWDFRRTVEKRGLMCCEKNEERFTPILQSLDLALYPPGSIPLHFDLLLTWNPLKVAI